MHYIFYFTDVHGYYDLYQAAINYCKEQDHECMIIFGGDACDRGPDGYKIMKELLNDPKVIYLKGNHEDMFVQAARYLLNNLQEHLNYDAAKKYLYKLYKTDECPIQIWNAMYNEGAPTLAAWIADGMPNNFVTDISKLPITFSTDTYDFCHTGALPKIFARVAQDEYEKELPDKEDAEILLWDRNMIGFGWTPNRTCIFGHTPTYHLPAKYYGIDKSKANAHPCKYLGNLDERLTGEKIAMDVGTASNGKLYVLNCLTLNAQGFEDKDFGNNEIHKHDVEKIEVIQF